MHYSGSFHWYRCASWASIHSCRCGSDTHSSSAPFSFCTITSHLTIIGPQNLGFALLVMYGAQLVLGGIIHWFKPKRPGRPPQNYFHVFLGLLIIVLSFYQVHQGYSFEWPHQTGRGPVPSAVNTTWTVWLIVSHLSKYLDQLLRTHLDSTICVCGWTRVSTQATCSRSVVKKAS